jgi:hypothetical protein
MSAEDDRWYQKAQALYRIPGVQTIEDYERRSQGSKFAHYLATAPSLNPIVPERKPSDHVKGVTIEEFIRRTAPTSRWPVFVTGMPQLPP